MAAFADSTSRHALQRGEMRQTQGKLADGEGPGTGRLVLVLKALPKRVTPTGWRNEGVMLIA